MLTRTIIVRVERVAWFTQQTRYVKTARPLTYTAVRCEAAILSSCEAAMIQFPDGEIAQHEEAEPLEALVAAVMGNRR